jgi:hypothetical protein
MPGWSVRSMTTLRPRDPSSVPLRSFRSSTEYVKLFLQPCQPSSQTGGSFRTPELGPVPLYIAHM